MVDMVGDEEMDRFELMMFVTFGGLAVVMMLWGVVSIIR